MRSSSIAALLLAASVAAPLSAQQPPMRKQRSLAELDHLRSLESLKGLKSLEHLGDGRLDAGLLALPVTDELVLTEIDTAFADADTFFPTFDRTRFVEAARDARTASDGTRYAFVTYRRAQSLS